MATEIERKFLVTGEGWRDAALGPGLRLRQGYLPNGGDATAPVVRVRLAGADGFLTIKGPGLLTRAEFEYAIPAAEAAAMLATLCTPPVLEKTRTGGVQSVASIASASAAGMGYSNSARLSRPGPLMVRKPAAPASRTRTTGDAASPPFGR